MHGDLVRLKLEQDAWETVRELKTGRFFHRMLAWGERRLHSVGGAHMSVGKFPQVEVTDLP